MELELTGRMQGKKRALWEALLQQEDLRPEACLEITALLWDGEKLVATASRQGSILKCIAVDKAHQGEGLTAQLFTALRQDAFAQGINHLFLYTKPKNEALFAPLFFTPVAKSEQVLLMESKQNGIQSFLQGLPKVEATGKIGALIANCNPFTLGHQYLIRTAASQCDRLYVFVLSEDKSEFSFADRMEMVKRGTADLPNVTVYPTGPYLISAVTFPTYFLKEQADTAQCALDCEIFAKHFVPYFGITHRYVGTEPNCPVTAVYNETMKKILPQKGVTVMELPRLTCQDKPISASAVRKLLKEGDREAVRALVPQTTYDYLQEAGL